MGRSGRGRSDDFFDVATGVALDAIASLVQRKFTKGSGKASSPSRPSSNGAQPRAVFADVEDFAEYADAAQFPHVAPINELVKKLRHEHVHEFIPFVAPTYGGTTARLLALFQSPGSRAFQAMSSPGVLSIENADGTTVRFREFLDAYAIDEYDVTAWNAFPWTGRENQRSPKDGREAAAALKSLLQVSTDVRVVLLLGRVAQSVWELLWRYDKAFADQYQVVSTFHTSPRLVDPEKQSPAQIAAYEADIAKAFTTVRLLLDELPKPKPYVSVDGAPIAPWDYPPDAGAMEVPEDASGDALGSGTYEHLFRDGRARADFPGALRNEDYWWDLIFEGQILSEIAEGTARDLTVPKDSGGRSEVRWLAEQYRAFVADYRDRELLRPEHELQDVIDAYRWVYPQASALVARGIGRSRNN